MPLNVCRILLVFAAFALLVVYPIPHVIALRNGFLVLAVALSGPVAWASLNATLKSEWGALAVKFLFAFYAWLVVVAVVIDPTPSASLRELVGQWITALAVFVIGLSISIQHNQSYFGRTRAVFLLIFLGAMVHILIQDIGSFWAGLTMGQFPTRYMQLTDHPANVGYVVALVAPLLGADIINRGSGGTGILPGNIWTINISTVLCCLALLTAGSRNSQVEFLGVSAVVAMTLWWRTRGKLSAAAKGLRLAALLLVTVTFSGAAYNLDGRWGRVAESIVLGWDTDSHLGWLDTGRRDMPVLSNGQPVEESAYLRTAFLKEGLRALNTHLLGTEINKNAFRNLLEKRFGHVNVAHAHNGLVDLGISAGIPAVILWCGFLICLYQAGAKRFWRDGDVTGYALMLLVIGFAFRMFLDSTLRDHIILQFMLCAGLLLGLCVSSSPAFMERPTP